MADMSKKKKQTDDIEIEYESGEGGADLEKKLKKLKKELVEIKKEKEEYLTGWQKERADFANFKKNLEEGSKATRSIIEEGVLTEFLNVLDSFNMAFANREAWEKVDPSWRQGVEYIFDQMNKIFEQYGVLSIGQEGEDFDPNLHQSVEMVATEDESQDGKVASVIQKGYTIGSRTLRPARVNVFEHQSK